MRYVIATAILSLALGLTLRYIGGGDPVGYTMLLVMAGLPIVGLLVTIDDDLPGGFSNPDGKTPGPWRQWENWADLVTRGAISGVGFAIDAGWHTIEAIVPWVIGSLGTVGSVLIHRRIKRKTFAHVA